MIDFFRQSAQHTRLRASLIRVVATYVLLAVCTFSIPACGVSSESKNTSAVLDSDILDTANELVLLLRDRDFRAIAERAHPIKGIRFSPYAYVEPESDLTLNTEQLLQANNNSDSLQWGLFDDTGDPIQMTIQEYFDRFVYDVDFASAPEIDFDQGYSRGNTSNNAALVYPDSSIIEYYHPGNDPAAAGNDWRSLRLVLHRKEDVVYLEGIIHDEWTP